MTNTQTQTEHKVIRCGSCTNPYNYNGKQIDAIVIYKDGKIIHSFKWLGNNNKYPEVYFDDIKKRMSVNLDKKEVFINKDRIYIHSDICQFKELEEVFDYETPTYKRYKTAFSIVLNCTTMEGYIDELGRFRYKSLEAEVREIKDYFNYRNEKTEDADRLESISAKFEEITNKWISPESILKIEAFYNIKFNNL